MIVISPTLRVVTPVGGGSGATWRGNEPAGMTLVDERPFNTVAEHDSPYSPAWDAFNAADLSIATDASAPQSPSNVLRETYPAGFVGGTSHGATAVPLPGGRTLYFCYWAKYSSNYQAHNTGFNKQWLAWTNGIEVFVFIGDGIGAGAITPKTVSQGTPTDGVWDPTLVPSVRLTRNQWDLIEITLTGNTAGSANGAIDWYINGTHVGSQTGIQWNASATSWEQLDFDPVWGGTGDSVTNEKYLDIDHVYISIKA